MAGLLSVILTVLSPLLWLLGKLAGFVVSIVTLLINGDRPPQKIPPVRNILLLESALSLAKGIRSRRLTSEEVVRAYIDRIKEVNNLLNCMVVDCFDKAIKEAKEVDQILNSKNIPEEYSEKNAPFLGVPVSVKEAFFCKGMPNTSGLVSRKGIIAEEDAPPVGNMKKAGCIVLGVTNCSELCMWYESANFVYGRTNNAYDIRRIVGGSSGGEGCILSAAGSVIGIGADIGGSIRMPGFFNGVFGHKPSPGVVSNDGQFPTAKGEQDKMMATGPLCRYAVDLDPLLRVMAGPEGLSKITLDAPVDLKSLNYFSIGTDMKKVLISPLDPELRDAQFRAAKYLEETFGVTVHHKFLHRFKYSVAIWSAKMQKSGGDSFTYLMGDHGKEVLPSLELLKRIFNLSNHTLPAILLGLFEHFDKLMPDKTDRLLTSCSKLRSELISLLGDNGVMLYPSHPKVAPFHNSPIVHPTNFAYTGIFNALGFPVTQVPLGLSKQGLPLGIQVVTTPYNDHLSLAVARELEKGFGGWVTELSWSSIAQQMDKKLNYN